MISIHAPLAGSDLVQIDSALKTEISIHAPLAGSDCTIYRQWFRGRAFQSTLPSQGATGVFFDEVALMPISIHAPLAGSDIKAASDYVLHHYISIHAPLAGSDAMEKRIERAIPHFNPRSPRRERPAELLSSPQTSQISIHAPLAGSDCCPHITGGQTGKFQSTLPSQGATQMIAMRTDAETAFQSTLPSQGAT